MNMRVVLDTNVLISALFWKGKSAKILDLAEKGAITICLTKEILDEITRVLDYPKIFKHLFKAGLSVNDVLHYVTELVEFYNDEVQLSGMIKNDPSDDKFLSCALVSRAKYIISGDSHVLKLKSFAGVSIVTPAIFLSVFKK
jgi:putative PIN family toxin of toxin-antitoxin system